ncbi:MAG: hypothetical protein CVV49_03530 [Spirochaetae bacterium HGW-Spirochaetae-5]|nr:MAG: hypothetical protein CVV49_03530 [Spirochaetae bacterium HGW-Spirochaetae-5]
MEGKDKLTVISAVPPWGFGGVNQVMEYLVNNISANYVFPDTRKKSLKKIIKKREFSKIFDEIERRKNYIEHFNRKISMFKNKTVLIIHPQSIGFELVKNIIKRNTKIYFYVMDNSFFCVKSYNHRAGNVCLDCISGNYLNAKDNACEPFPYPYDIEDNIDFLDFLQEEVDKLFFVTQNKNQTELIQNHFGHNVNIKQIGLVPNDVLGIDCNPTNRIFFDFIYHGHAVDAKGFSYVLSLAQRMANRLFLFPFCKPENIDVSTYPNIYFVPMTWDSGLEHHIEFCGVVLCLSLWSAPIEGALLKSLLKGKKVAVFKTQYTFNNELLDDCVLKLNSLDINENALILEEYLKSFIDINKQQLYIKGLIAEMENKIKVFFETDF